MPRQRGGKSTSPRTDAKRVLPEQRERDGQETAPQTSDSTAPSKPLSQDLDVVWNRGDEFRGLAPGLHIVATPIGNLGDMTIRALETLKGANLIACEDTRVSGNLLFRFGLKTPLLAYHEHNAEIMRPRLLQRLSQGEAIALISDAGTPLVSDPGYKLVRDVIAAGYGLHSTPGPSAMLAALVLSGLPPDRFFFAGFLESRSHARRQALATMTAIPGTLIFYESAPRLASSLADMASVLGDRAAAVARELTKLHEEVRRGRLADLAAHYAAAGPPKGEIVILVGPAETPPEASLDDLDAALTRALACSSLSRAVAEVAALLGMNRKRVYARALELAGSTGVPDDPR